MELEFFCKPGEDLEWFDYWKNFCMKWLTDLGMDAENLRFRDHGEDELSHYSNATSDIEYLFPFGWGEVWGIADRTDFDLKRHSEHSGTELSYQDPTTNEKYIPYCIEPSVGADRIALAFLIDAYEDEELEDGSSRSVLKFHPAIAPIKAAVFPLTKKLKEETLEVFELLSKHFNVEYDEAGSIGKRYRRHDEIGTPYCITFDFDSLEDKAVTIRNRDTMEQERISIDTLVDYLSERIAF
jgi:glycyl-tRNA synthetase